MPKMKTHSATKKRFDLTGSGKLRRRRAFKSHLLEHKPAKRKRHLRKGSALGSRGVRGRRPQAERARVTSRRIDNVSSQAKRQRAQEAPEGP
jgi:large subunit ribosomal protein L35